jgi:hypothetical protein
VDFVKPRVAHGWGAASIALALVVLIPHLPLLLGRASPIWDALDFFGPYSVLVGDFARQGQFLLWNPFINGGSPDYIEPQVGAFSPLLLLFAWGGTHGFELYWLTIWLLGPLSLLVLSRYLGAPAWGGLVAALGLAFSGFYTGNAEHTAMLSTVSFLPLLLWRMDVAVIHGRPRAAAEAGALWGLSGLAGYPGLVLLNGCFVALWCLGRVLNKPAVMDEGTFRRGADLTPSRTVYARLLHLVLMHGIMLLVGLVVLAPTYAPFFVEGPAYSHRAGALPRETAVENDALHPASLVTMTTSAFGFVDMFEYTDISMRSIYVGVLLPVLAGFALLNRSRGMRWWLLLLAIGFLAAAMGRALPVRGWIYDWFPPTRYFRHSALFRCYFIVAIALLSVYGARDLATALHEQALAGWRRFTATTLTAVVVAVVVFVVAIGILNERATAIDIVARAHASGMWLGAAAVVTLASRAMWRRRIRIVPIALVALAIADALGTALVARPTMYSVNVAPWQTLAEAHNRQISPRGRIFSRQADTESNRALVTKVPALKGYGPLAGPLFHRYSGDAVLAASAVGPNRFWFSADAIWAGPSEACFDEFRSRAAELDAPPLVLHPADAMTQPYEQGVDARNSCGPSLRDAPAVTVIDPQKVKVVTYESQRMTLEVDAPGDGWLVVTDSWSPGWTASVNGRATQIMGANFVFRAVPATAGRNVIDFQFHAFGFPWLVAASWLVLAAVGAVSVVSFVAVRRQIPSTDLPSW